MADDEESRAGSTWLVPVVVGLFTIAGVLIGGWQADRTTTRELEASRAAVGREERKSVYAEALQGFAKQEHAIDGFRPLARQVSALQSAPVAPETTAALDRAKAQSAEQQAALEQARDINERMTSTLLLLGSRSVQERASVVFKRMGDYQAAALDSGVSDDKVAAAGADLRRAISDLIVACREDLGIEPL